MSKKGKSIIDLLITAVTVAPKGPTTYRSGIEQSPGPCDTKRHSGNGSSELIRFSVQGPDGRSFTIVAFIRTLYESQEFQLRRPLPARTAFSRTYTAWGPR